MTATGELFERRDAALAESLAVLTRKVKRALQDDQNIMLERLRDVKAMITDGNSKTSMSSALATPPPPSTPFRTPRPPASSSRRTRPACPGERPRAPHWMTARPTSRSRLCWHCERDSDRWQR